MNTKEISLSRNGILLIVAILFCLLFGGYLVAYDTYYYNDVESAMSVLVLYSIIGIFATLFLFGKKLGVFGLIALSAILLISQMGYIIAYVSQTTIDPSWHSPFANGFITVLNAIFPLLILTLSIKEYRESR